MLDITDSNRLLAEQIKAYKKEKGELVPPFVAKDFVHAVQLLNGTPSHQGQSYDEILLGIGNIFVQVTQGKSIFDLGFSKRTQQEAQQAIKAGILEQFSGATENIANDIAYYQIAEISAPRI